MEKSTSAATAITVTTTGAIIQPTKSPEAESETPPRIKPMSFTNGVLKRHKHHPMFVGGVSYKECLKNHAASLGGHALDGCGEFMPAPTATATDPTSLRCAACGCHRNFHRREPEELGNCGGGTATHVIEYHPQHRHHPLPPPGAHLSAPPHAVAACRVESPGSDNNSPPPISSTYYPGSAPHMLLALSSGGGTPEDKTLCPITNTTTNGNIELQHHQIFGTTPPQMPCRKRHRTKFSQEQKEKMYEFAEKLGWKMVKSNEELVKGFCNEIGIERGVFKVWMHNNKNTLGKRSASTTPTAVAAANYGINANNQGGISIEDINDPIEEDDQHGINENEVVGNSHSSSITNNNNHHHQQHNGRSIESINNAVPTNGSSCSS